MKDKKVRFAFAVGSVWGVNMFITTIFSYYTNYGTEFLTLVDSLYPWYSISFSGAIVGGVFGFIDLFIITYLVGWVYEKLS